MSARSFINLILKIFGLFFIIKVLDALSRTLSVLVYFPQYESRKQALYNLGVTLPPLILYILFAILLLFSTNYLIRLFRLDKGISEQIIPMRIHRSMVLVIAVIAAGGWMLVSGIPELFRQIVYYYQERKLYVRMIHPDISYLAMAFAKVVIGLILIIFNRTVVNIIELKRRNQDPWYWPARVPFTRKKKKLV